MRAGAELTKHNRKNAAKRVRNCLCQVSGVFSKVSAEAVCIQKWNYREVCRRAVDAKQDDFPALALHHTNCIRRLQCYSTHVYCSLWNVVVIRSLFMK